MAEAVANYREVTSVTLEMTPEEARAIIAVTNRVGGSPAGYQGRCRAVCDVLKTVLDLDPTTMDEHKMLSGALTFTDQGGV